MATSGSIDFNLARNQLIRSALRKHGHTSTHASEYADAAEDLNVMLKHWQTQGFKLWKRAEATLFLQKSSQSYSLGSTGTHATESYVSTTVGTAYSAGTTLVLASTSGMTAGDNIGVELDGGTREWKTILSVDSATDVTLSGALSGAAAVGNTVYTYTTKISRPLRVENVRLAYSDGSEIPVHVISRAEYMDRPNKANSGAVVEVHYQPTLTNGTLYVWPTTDDVDNVLKFTYLKPIEDFDALGDDMDLPQEWTRAIIWNLAAEMITTFGTPDPDASRIEARAALFLNEVTMFDAEDAPVQFCIG